MVTKRLKRKLVLEIGSNLKSPGDIPTEYSNNKLKWLCDVIVEGPDSVVDEYTISPDKKLYLSDFLNIIHKEIDRIIDTQAVCWGIRIYRLTASKR